MANTKMPLTIGGLAYGISFKRVGDDDLQRVHITYGGSNEVFDVTAATPLPVTIISGDNEPGLTNTQLRADPLPLPTGAATAAKQDVIKAVLDALNSHTSLADKGKPIVANANADLSPIPKAITCMADGSSITYVPNGNANNVTLTCSDCPLGFTPIHKVRRVVALTGAWATAED